ncbi:MAG: tRNA lysidine(34) synthetase TilS [Sumerlaeia bacterium]
MMTKHLSTIPYTNAAAPSAQVPIAQLSISNWEQLATPTCKVLSAFSGGADSVYLALKMKARLERGQVASVRLAHVHHGTPHAEEFAEFALDFARSHDLPLDVLYLTSTWPEGESQEAFWRSERLRLLREAARRSGADVIAMGHHEDDLAETLLLMAMRGCGPTGMGSMAEWRLLEAATDERKPLWLIRPILATSRADILRDLEGRGQSWIEDPSNRDPSYRRNRLRHDIIPVLREMEPGVTRTLARAARLCGEESRLLSELAEDALRDALLAQAAEYRLLDRISLRAMRRTLAKCALRRAFLAFGDQYPSAALAEDVMTRLEVEDGDPSRFENKADGMVVRALVTNHYVLIYQGSLSEEEALARALTQAGRALILAADFGETVLSAELEEGEAQRFNYATRLGVRLARAAELPVRGSDSAFAGLARAAIDLDSTEGALVLRLARAGESIELATAGSKSVAEAAAEAGVPPAVRGRVAVVADQAGILWIPGVRRGPRAWVRPYHPADRVCILSLASGGA